MSEPTKTMVILQQAGSQSNVSIQFAVLNPPSHIPKGDAVFLKLTGAHELTLRRRVWHGQELLLYCDVDNSAIIDHLLNGAVLLPGRIQSYLINPQKWE